MYTRGCIEERGRKRRSGAWKRETTRREGARWGTMGRDRGAEEQGGRGKRTAARVPREYNAEGTYRRF